jgi:thymidylate kinase
MKITIEGKAGEGKTTVACVLLDALNAAGFDVELTSEEPEIPFSNQKTIDRRIESLSSEPHKLSIELVTRPR